MNSRLLFVFAFMLASLAPSLFCKPSHAQPVQLDATFGSDGIVTTEVGGSSVGHKGALQDDGNIVVVGSQSDVQGDFVVVRYLPDGSLDPGFGNGGITISDFGDFTSANNLALQDDGKIVVVGAVDGGSEGGTDFAVVRYNNDGTLDNNFGTNGLVRIEFTGGEIARAVAIQPDDKIVVVGGVDTDLDLILDGFGVARLNSDGSPDMSFDLDGMVLTDFGASSDASTVLIDNGQILVGGSVGGAVANFGVALYNDDGALDSNFGTGGKSTIGLEGLVLPQKAEMAFQGDKIVFAGGIDSDGDSVSDTPALARFNSDGSPDTTFGTNAKSIVALPGLVGSEARALVISSNGQIVIAGGGTTDQTNDKVPDAFLLARFDANGSLDSTFGSNGVVSTEVAASSAANDLLIQTDGKMVAVGFSDQDEDGTIDNDDDFALVRYEFASAPPPDGGSGCRLIESKQNLWGGIMVLFSVLWLAILRGKVFIQGK